LRPGAASTIFNLAGQWQRDDSGRKEGGPVIKLKSVYQQPAREHTVNLVYTARDGEHNTAPALKQFLEEKERG
jgi:hypothetical protein